jgi:hypothetical protein
MDAYISDPKMSLEQVHCRLEFSFGRALLSGPLHLLHLLHQAGTVLHQSGLHLVIGHTCGLLQGEGHLLLQPRHQRCFDRRSLRA